MNGEALHFLFEEKIAEEALVVLCDPTFHEAVAFAVENLDMQIWTSVDVDVFELSAEESSRLRESLELLVEHLKGAPRTWQVRDGIEIRVRAGSRFHTAFNPHAFEEARPVTRLANDMIDIALSKVSASSPWANLLRANRGYLSG